MNREEWLKKELEKEYEKKRLALEQKAEKEAKNFEKILNNAKIDEQEIENVVEFFKLLRISGCKASTAIRLTFEVFPPSFYNLGKDTIEHLDPENICKLL